MQKSRQEIFKNTAATGLKEGLMYYAVIFLLIFGCLLLLAAAKLWFSKDPRNSVFFAKVQGKQGKEEARRTARQIAAAVAGVGLAIIVYCVIRLIRGA